MTKPFSDECPKLLQEHFDHLKNSAISKDVMDERGYISVLGKTPLREAGFGKSQQRAPGILIPLHGVDGLKIGYQYRPDHPRLNNKKKPIKYENPVGSSIRIDVPPRCRQQLGNPGIPIYITEGVKKVDSLATAGACALGLTGVWGFKGKNPFGGTTILADFDYISFKDRLVYLLFDSDSASNPHVKQALVRLAEHIKRKQAKLRILNIPPGPEGEKVGADDFLSQGHVLSDFISLESIDTEVIKETLRERSGETYCIENGRICWIKQTTNGSAVLPLCNFTARVTEDIVKDDGQETSRFFKIAGNTGTGISLPTIEVAATSFSSMNWVTSEWGLKTIMAAGQTVKDRLREAMQLQSQDAVQRSIFTHTGWREIDGNHLYLTAGGAIGSKDIEVNVELEPPLRRYILLPAEGDPSEAVQSSFDFLFIGDLKVTLPVWASMYLAPLSEFIDPAFTLWYAGASGSFKSVLTSLALCHFGDFDYLHLPAAWRDTRNQLEKLLFLAKDIPLIIDDWAPGQDSAQARELESKAEHIVRAQGNRQGKGRMRADMTLRVSYAPRGLLITSGEQLPSGHSQTSRIVTVEIEREDILRDSLTAAQHNAFLYRIAMSHYLTWISLKWDELSRVIPAKWNEWRDLVYQESRHPRLPSDIASLYAGLFTATWFAIDTGCIDENYAGWLREDGWQIFIDMVTSQSARIETERPSSRFIYALRAMMDQGKAVLWSIEDEDVRTPIPGTTPIGWNDGNGNMFLNPSAAYNAIHQFCQQSGDPFTFKEDAVWKDLKRMGYSVCQDGRTKSRIRIYGEPKWIIQLPRKVLVN